jgi:hypothetical protein
VNFSTYLLAGAGTHVGLRSTGEGLRLRSPQRPAPVESASFTGVSIGSF